jgi:hypothetical protein
VPAWQISLPPTVIEIPFKASEEIQAAAVEEIKQLALKGYDVFSSVVEKLCDIGIEADPAKKEGMSASANICRIVYQTKKRFRISTKVFQLEEYIIVGAKQIQ